MNGGWAELVRGGNAGRSAVVGGGMIVHALNTFIVTTILPSVVRDIGGLRYFAWSTVLYVVASLLGGANCARLLRRIGVRNAYRTALLGFAAGSVVCALAPSMAVLLLGRFVQGLFAGTLSALSFTIIRTLFAERLWPRALSVVSVAWGVATLLGPAVGGVFAQWGVWRAAFWSVAAAAPVLLLLVEVSLPRDLRRTAAARDRHGAAVAGDPGGQRARGLGRQHDGRPGLGRARAAGRRGRVCRVRAARGERRCARAAGGRDPARRAAVRGVRRDGAAAGRHHAGDLSFRISCRRCTGWCRCMPAI